MDEILRYAVGLDVGTSTVRVVMASVSEGNKLDVIGYAEVPNAGMRRGVVVDLAGPVAGMNKALVEVERMSGQNVKSAVVSINGAELQSVKTEGMIAVGGAEHEINENDVARVEEVALQGKVVPANRIALEVVPLQYILDGQAGIKAPVGMTGSRLELHANVVTALVPSYDNLRKTVETVNVAPEIVMPSAVAAARAVLNERQRENGVAVVDFGHSTTGIAVYEEGDLQYIGVIPVGSNNITNDLATMLAIDTEIAEEVKRRFATGDFSGEGGTVTLRWHGKDLRFSSEQVNEVVQERLEEIFSMIQKELVRAGYDKKLPEGIVLTGGGARMKHLDQFARQILNRSVKIGMPHGLNGVAEATYKPEYATAVGLMLTSAGLGEKGASKKVRKSGKKEKSGGILKKIFGKF